MLKAVNEGATEYDVVCEPACAKSVYSVSLFIPGSPRVCFPAASCAVRLAYPAHLLAIPLPLRAPSLPHVYDLQLQPDCVTALTEEFNADSQPVGVIGSRFFKQCADLQAGSGNGASAGNGASGSGSGSGGR